VELTADEVRAAPGYKEGKPVVILDGLHNVPVSDQGLLKNPKRNARMRTKSRPSQVSFRSCTHVLQSIRARRRCFLHRDIGTCAGADRGARTDITAPAQDARRYPVLRRRPIGEMRTDDYD
jgi:hypothetical protein